MLFPDTDDRITSYICDGCDAEVRIFRSDGDRETLEGWIMIHDAQTGELIEVDCPDCSPVTIE